MTSRGNAGYARFRAALLEGDLKPGQMVTQGDLCALLDLSLSPLRDTLTLLEADGLISVRKRAGIRVFSPDVDFIRQNFQFRTLIEREALPAFVDTVSDGWLVETRQEHKALLEAIQARREIAAAEGRMRDIDTAFHSTIVGALHNPMITKTHADVTENIKLARVLNQELASPKRLVETLGEHLVLIDAMEARDLEAAASALGRHFSQSIHRVFS